MIRNILIFCVLLSAAHAQQYPIAELRATGSTRFAEPDILRTTGLEKGKRDVTLTQVKDAATKLLGLGAFSEVSYRHTAALGGIKVEFSVKDIEQFIPAEFDNVVWVPRAELIVALHERVPLFNGELPANTTGSLPDDVAAALQGLLNERGVQGTAAWTLSPRDGPPEAYIYGVDDVTVTIRQVNMAGTTSALSPLLETATRPLLGTRFDRPSLKKFIADKLLPIYRQRGYLRASIGEPEVTVLAHQGRQTTIGVTLPVQEGRIYTFAGLRWSGNRVRPEAELAGAISLAPGEVANGVKLEGELTQVRTRYAQLGYMHMTLELAPVYDDAAGTVRYAAAVKEGDIFRMGKLDISGLQPSSAEKLRQLWRMREGEVFDAGYIPRFFTDLRLPETLTYVVEQSEGEAANTVDLTIIFCKAGTKCLPSAPNQLYIPEENERRR